MSLEDKLAKIREGAKKRLPPEALETMHRATDELRGSGIMDNIIKVGDTLPALSLTNTMGETVNSVDLLKKGPLVLTFFRGHW